MNITGWTALAIGVVLAVIAYNHIKGKGILANPLSLRRGGQKLLGFGVGTLAVLFVIGSFSSSVPVLGSVFDFTDQIKFGAQSAGVTTGSSSSQLNTNVGMKTVETLTATAKEAGSNSYTAVQGLLLFYDAATNPSSATANPVDTVSIASGSGSSTGKKLKTGVDYRVVFANTTTDASYYDKDLGIVRFDGNDLSLNGALTFDVGEVQLVATLDDILDEISNSSDLGTAMNGQANTVLGTDEIGCSTQCAADGTFLYDESVGDGVWYIEVTPGASGSNAYAKSAVLQFKKDLSNPPEGDEYSSITAQLRTGTDFGIPSDITNNWKDEIPLDLGDLKAGQSSTYRITFNVVEANEDGNDDWTLRFDDLGEHLGKDVRNSVRATADTVTYGGSQA